MASLGSYIATSNASGLQIHQYADSRIRTSINGGRRVGIDVSTDYPESGAVTLRIVETDGHPFALTLRVPSWAGGSTLIEPDRRSEVGPGVVVVERPFVVGDEVSLRLPVGPRWTTPDPRIDAIRGTVAVEKGPLVLCLESVDLPGDNDVGAIRVDPTVPPMERDSAVVVKAQLVDELEGPWPYRPGHSGEENPPKAIDLPLIAYHDWANRGPATMRVWLPTVAEDF
jgi:DUF1680 family protein